MKSKTKFNLVMLALFLLLPSGISLAQTTIKLSSNDNTSSFKITKKDNSTLLKLFGDGGFYLGGRIYSNGVIPIEGEGVRLMWHPTKAAFRAGQANETSWNDANIGTASFASGWFTTASGINAVAMGGSTVASGGSSVALGDHTIASGELSLATGSFTTASGYSSTAMGFRTTASGHFSTAMGLHVSTNGREGSFFIGDASPYLTSTFHLSSLDNQMSMRFANGYRLYTNAAASKGAYLPPNATSWSTLSDSTKKENFVKANGEYFLNSLSKLKLGSWNYKDQDFKEYRHYGPMAQEIFHYFGKDELGTIGNDTTLATADVDGIMMIMLQALEKRTGELQEAAKRIEDLEKIISVQKTKLNSQQETIKEFRNELYEMKKVVSVLSEGKKSFSDRSSVNEQ